MNLVLPNIDEYEKESGLYVHYDREWEIEKYGYETKAAALRAQRAYYSQKKQR